MYTDIRGRVRNVPLPASQALLPLYEAIINSFQAIEDASESDGRIDIFVARKNDELLSGSDNYFSDIAGFSVTDNGIGFNEPNFKAFQTSDTTYKAKRGGRGIGRFLWLTAFDRAEIDSHYLEDSKMRRRAFKFEAEGDGIKNLTESPSDAASPTTTVRLIGFREKYQRQCPKKLETIAARIVEHNLEYFIRSDCPVVVVHDEATGDSLNLKEMFVNEILTSSDRIPFKVRDNDFRILHIRLRSSHASEHLVHYCADERVVRSERLMGKVPNLARHLEDTEGEQFIYAAYVMSSLLDESVNSERTDFLLAESSDELLADEITWQTIQSAVFHQCRDYLQPYTEPVKRRKKERINAFVANEAPMYRPIMKYIDTEVATIDPEVDDTALDMKLYEAYHSLQVRLKAEGQELLTDKRGQVENFEEFDKRLQSYFEKISDINAADLARYVCHRRAVLDFLHQQLSIEGNGTYRREERIHNIIFPMGATSDEVLPDANNLWLIDEKLAYHEFLASDKQLRAMMPLDTSSQKEPDIIVFEKACAFAPSPDPPWPAIVIIEFKRPMRKGYTEEKNPFVQIRKYITAIRSGNARTHDGRDVPIQTGIPFYCYVICDIEKSLEEQAYDFELMKTPDGQGFFGFKKEYNAYFEVVSYSKMVSDAKKRNAVLFRKLGLPDRVGW